MFKLLAVGLVVILSLVSAMPYYEEIFEDDPVRARRAAVAEPLPLPQYGHRGGGYGNRGYGRPGYGGGFGGQRGGGFGGHRGGGFGGHRGGGFGGSASQASASSQSFGGGGFGGSASQASSSSQSFGRK